MISSLIRLFAAILLALGGIAVSSTAADATRPTSGAKDVCFNISGIQGGWQTVGTGPYRVVRTGYCVRR